MRYSGGDPQHDGKLRLWEFAPLPNKLPSHMILACGGERPGTDESLAKIPTRRSWYSLGVASPPQPRGVRRFTDSNTRASITHLACRSPEGVAKICEPPA